MSEPLLGLCMIVKNEAHGIRKTLEAIKPFVDVWTILDTGSTDGTQDVIRETMMGVYGELHEEPFVDFSTSRNRALDLHGDKTRFVIMPDSEDVLVNGERLRAFLNVVDGDAYHVTLRRGDLTYVLPLVSRTSAGWRYVGRVHELLQKHGSSAPTITIPDIVLEQHPTGRSVDATRKRWERDVAFLEEDARREPSNPRTSFYLAQTYECLDRHEDAIREFERRIAIGGWRDETFMAYLRRARMMLRGGRPWPEVQQAFLDAHLFDPSRAEPLYELAKHYHEKDQHPLTFMFASRAAQLPPSTSNLFVEKEINEWQAADLAAIAAFYIDEPGVKKEGAKLAEQALRSHPEDFRLRQNRAFYAPSMLQMFGAVARRINFQPEEPWVATNPSVHYDSATEQWQCVVRTTNYRIVNGQYLTPDDNVIFTRNFMLEMNIDLEVTKAVEMLDFDPTPRSDFPVHGYEDCRLFTVGTLPFCTATVCDFGVGPEHGRREIVLLEIEPETYEVRKAKPVRGRWSVHHQKNWMPVAEQKSDEMIAVYSLHPSAVIGLDLHQEDLLEGNVEANVHLRGGSQMIPIEGGYLCLTHDVSFTCSGARTYLHRFVMTDLDFEVMAMTDPFYFVKMGIEFAAGLAHDGSGRLVASFGVDDSRAYLAFFSLDKVLSRMRTDFVV